MTPVDSTRRSTSGPETGSDFRARAWPRRLRRVLGLAALAFAVGLAWETLAFARIAAGYGATITALQVFGAGDTLATVEAERLHLPLGLGRFVKLEVEPATHTARARAFGLASGEATWHEGWGARRVSEVAPAVELPPAPAPLPPLPRDEPWPRGESDALAPLPAPLEAALARAVDTAFTAPDGGAPIATHALIVVRDGAFVAERYGPGISPDRRLLGWSMTKSVLALLLGRLVALERAPDVTTPVLAPEWTAPDDPRRAITVEHLLRMTSGLDFLADYEVPWSDSLRMLFVAPDAAAYAAGMELAHAPGTHWSYSDGSSNLLARWVQARAGATLAEQLAFPARELFGPLGMRTAVISLDPAGHWVGSSLMQASARDWARLGLLVARDGVHDGRRLLPEGWIATLASPTLASDHRIYGAHLWRFDEQDPHDSHDAPAPNVLAGWLAFVGHDQQYVWIERARGLVIVRLGLADARFDPTAFAARVASLDWDAR